MITGEEAWFGKWVVALKRPFASVKIADGVIKFRRLQLGEQLFLTPIGFPERKIINTTVRITR